MGKGDTVTNEKKYLSAAAAGRIIPIGELDDGIYSTMILGDGYAVYSKSTEVFSPADGTVERVSNNGHSFNILTDDGLNLLIHIGRDSSCDTTLPVTPSVNAGDKVQKGDIIGTVSCDPDKRGHECVIEVVISNSETLETLNLVCSKAEDKNTPVLRYKK